MDGEHEYAFQHGLTREVAYQSVPRARRAQLHAQFAGWLERVGGGRTDHVSLLAYHYAEAAQPDVADLAWGDNPADADRLRQAAVTWLRKAGELAVNRYDIDEGIALLERALSYAEDAKTASALLREIG